VSLAAPIALGATSMSDIAMLAKARRHYQRSRQAQAR
jgi:hypothetical protein